jgi:hypothetical protein
MSMLNTLAQPLQSNHIMDCFAVTPIESARYKVATHISFQNDIDLEVCTDFTKRWNKMLLLAKQNMPSVLVHTVEIRALITMLENPYTIQMVKSAISECDDTKKGFLKFLASPMCEILPITARNELFSFIQMFICPQSYFYPNVELLICRNLSLMEFLMIGHCQIEGFIFDGATEDSHAVVAAKSIGKQVLLTNDDLILPPHCDEIEVISNSITNVTLFWD